LALYKLRNHKWLLFDISIITKDLNLNNAVGYEYETLKEYEKYFGRLIIEFRNKSQNLIRNAESVIDQCSVIQILEDTFDNDLFPGYENVRLNWKDLKRIASKSNWITALENQKAVYLITDKSNGKMYVGSAYGETMLLEDGKVTFTMDTEILSSKTLSLNISKTILSIQFLTL
jgi:hypothetical protein